MSITDKYERIALDEITVNRDTRQRKEISTEGLKESISRIGVLHPIIITRDKVLIAGERRWQASKELNLPDIPCRYYEDLSQIEIQIVELEENIKRNALDWREETLAVARLHDLYLQSDPTWTQTKTADELSITQSWVGMLLRVAKDIDSPRLADVASARAAYNVLSRVDSRRAADAVSDIIAGVGAATGAKPQGGEPGDDSKDTGSPRPPRPPEPILHGNFLEWAPKYSGQPFNFIHCDFPYGIKVFAGAMSGRGKWRTYSDKPDIYWDLLYCLCDNLDRLMAHSGHLMFWFSMEHYVPTLEFFREQAPSLNFSKFPLLWVKSDNVGILPDPTRGPRRVYETALIASREDRLILKPVSNAYSAPTDKADHHSTKPVPVLKHFFQMFVGETTRMLDPTCGSGSAIRAAHEMGAEEVLGLELDAEHAENAQRAFSRYWVLRQASGGR